MYLLILLFCDGEEFGQLHLKGDRQVGLLRDDAAILHRKEGKEPL
jgi:hypothetical protein